MKRSNNHAKSKNNWLMIMVKTDIQVQSDLNILMQHVKWQVIHMRNAAVFKYNGVDIHRRFEIYGDGG